MYVAPESKVLYALANVAATSVEETVTNDPNALPPQDFEE